MPFILSLYQTISCLISIFMYLITFWNIWVQAGEPFIFFFISLILLYYVGYIGYINLLFVLKSKVSRNFLRFNQLFNVLQIFHFSILGLVYYFITGPEITPSFFYSDKILWQVQSHFFNIQFNLSYHGNDSDINAGINVIPLLYLVMLNYYGRFAKRKI